MELSNEHAMPEYLVPYSHARDPIDLPVRPSLLTSLSLRLLHAVHSSVLASAMAEGDSSADRGPEGSGKPEEQRGSRITRNDIKLDYGSRKMGFEYQLIVDQEALLVQLGSHVQKPVHVKISA